jgi:hypothetical protein
MNGERANESITTGAHNINAYHDGENDGFAQARSISP